MDRGKKHIEEILTARRARKGHFSRAEDDEGSGKRGIVIGINLA